LDAVGTRTVALEDGQLHSYVGGWPEYLRVREDRSRAKPSAPKKPKPRATPPKAPADGTRLEQEIEQAERALEELESELADPGAWSTPEKTAKHTARHQQAKEALEELYRRWEETIA
jgi:ATP-binding cassette subfamily F protein 3